MTLAPGNLTQLGYNAYEGNPPGWRTRIWKGVSIIDGTPVQSLDILDNQGLPLVIPINSRIAEIGIRIGGDLIGTNGDRLKVGASAADVNAYIVNSLPVASGIMPAHSSQLALTPWTTVLVGAAFTPRLWLHAANVASANTIRASTTSPTVTVIPAQIPTKPILIETEIYFMQPTGGPIASDPLYLSDAQERRVLALPET